MHKRMIGMVAAMIAGTLAAGCANDGGLLAGSLTTASVTEQAAASATPQQKVDPQCVALMSKIDQLRKEGTPARIEKISTGKGTTAQVKRESLARITELDKANAEFQSRCSTLSTPQQAAVAPSVTQAKAETTATAKATDAAAGAVAGKTASATASPAQPAAPAATAATAAKDTVTKPAKKAAKKAAPKSEKTEKAAAAAPAAAPAAEAKPAAAAKTAAVAQPAAAAAAVKPTASFSSATPAVAISAPAVVTTTATKPAE